jgi:hypothetical protein
MGKSPLRRRPKIICPSCIRLIWSFSIELYLDLQFTPDHCDSLAA